MSAKSSRRALTWVRDLADELVVRARSDAPRVVTLGAGAFVGGAVLALALVQSSLVRGDVSAQFDELAAARIYVDLPIRGAIYPDADSRTLEALAQPELGVRIAWAYSSPTTITSVLTPFTGITFETTRWDVGGDPSLLELEPELADSPLGGGLLIGAGSTEVRPHRYAPVEVDGRPTYVDGILRQSRVIPQLLQAVVERDLAESLQLDRTGVVVFSVPPGGAEKLAARVRSTFAPASPELVSVRYTPEPARLRAATLGDVDRLRLALALGLMSLGALSAGLATWARVLGQQRLIGLQRAMGARQRDIVSEYVAESTVVAATGAAAGALVGTAVAAIPLIGSGRLTVSWLVLGLFVTATALLNALSSAIPVWWVTRLPPAQALRSP